jgi:hypothetical protein
MTLHERGRPGQGALHDTTLVARIPDPAEVTRLLALSDERDLHQRRRLAAWLDGYRLGRAHGRAEGRAEAEAEMTASWYEVAHPIARGGPPRDELERRRWGPGGRARFGEPRPGDYPGQGAAAA